jgi:hypothetical protein
MARQAFTAHSRRTAARREDYLRRATRRVLSLRNSRRRCNPIRHEHSRRCKHKRCAHTSSSTAIPQWTPYVMVSALRRPLSPLTQPLNVASGRRARLQPPLRLCRPSPQWRESLFAKGTSAKSQAAKSRAAKSRAATTRTAKSSAERSRAKAASKELRHARPDWRLVTVLVAARRATMSATR